VTKERNLNVLITHFIKITTVGGILLFCSPAFADLQWITGGTPKNAPESQTGTQVTDAPGTTTTVAPTANQEVVVSHMITCTKIVNQYPADSVNYFYLDKSDQINYYAYFLMKPSSRIHTAVVEIYNPLGFKILKHEQEFTVGFTDRLLTVENETYQWYLITATASMNSLNSDNGQTGLPKDVGLYTVHLIVDGQLVGITFFYVKPQAPKAPASILSTPPPSSPGASIPTSPASFMAPQLNTLPIQAIPQGIQ
jgi:hypothetical protein